MRVCIVPEYPASLMTGGLQVQAEETYHALSSIGGPIEPEMFNWSDRCPLADLYHFIGFPPYLQQITELLQEAGRPYLVTLLFGGSAERVSLWLARIRQLLNSQVLRRRARHRAITMARGIIAITDADAQAARFIYRLKSDRVHMVPNGVTQTFFEASPEAWTHKFGGQPFILCVGAVQRRKNQLLLLQAANQLRLPVVLLGSVLPGETPYAEQVARAIKSNEAYGGRWLKDLRNEDALLVSAYAACRLFVLLSARETQPLSVMQAMAAHKPVLLLEARYLNDSLFRDLPTVPSTELSAVCDSLNRCWRQGQATELSGEYTWLNVAKRLQTIYTGVAAEMPARQPPA